MLKTKRQDYFNNIFLLKFGNITIIGLLLTLVIALFGTTSPVALATIVGVLVEVPVMLALVGFANRTTGWFKN